MSTFVKRSPTTVPTPKSSTTTSSPQKSSSSTVPSSLLPLSGTKPSVHNGQLLISSGLADLDSHLGGGIPLGSLILLFEDGVSNYSNHLLNYYLSEGLSCGHKVFYMGTPSDLEQSLPLNYTRYQMDNPSSSSTNNTTTTTNNNTHANSGGHSNSRLMENKMMIQQQQSADLKISWRYGQFVQDQIALKQQSMKNRTVSANSSSSSSGGSSSSGSSNKKLIGSVQCHEYDLSKPVQHDLVAKARESGKLVERSMFEQGKLTRLLQLIQSEQQSQLSGDQETGFMSQVSRIGIRSMHMLLDETDAKSLSSVAQFFHVLKILCRKSLSTAFITIPKNYSNQALVKTIQGCCDIVLRMDSFIGEHINVSEWEMSEYTGLFHIEKLPRMNTLAPYLPDTLNYAFKVKRRKVYIEKMSAPPEETRSATVKDRPRYLVEGSGTSSASSSTGCGSSSTNKKNDLDF